MGEEEEEEAAVTGVQDQCSNMSLRQWPYIHPFPEHWGSPQWFYWIEEPRRERAWWWCRFLATESIPSRARFRGDSESTPSRWRSAEAMELIRWKQWNLSRWK